MIGLKNSVDSGRQSSARYYVYTGPACEEWIDYDRLEDAIAENPGQWVFDRTTREAVPQTRN